MLPNQKSVFSLSSPQQEIWYDQMLNPESSHYNIGGHCCIHDAVEIEHFKQAVEHVVSTSQALRAHFGIDENGIPFQEFKDPAVVPYEFIDYSGESNPEALFDRHFDRVFQTKFDLIDRPLFRFFLVKFGNKSFRFVFLFHHLVADGWSGSLVNNRVAQAYRCLCENETLDAQTGSYADFISEDLDYLSSDRFETQREYWRAKTEQLPALPFKRKYIAETNEIPIRGMKKVYLPRLLVQSIEQLAAEANSSLYAAFLGVFYAYFHLICKKDGCVIGMPTLNRVGRFKKTEGVFAGISIGKFDYGTENSFSELIELISKELKQNYRHVRFPFSEIHRLCAAENAQERLFDLTISYEKHTHAYLFGSEPSVATSSEVAQPQVIPLDVHIRDYSEDQDVLLEIKYNPDYFDPEDVDLLADQYLWLLDQFLAFPQVALNQINAISEKEISLISALNKPEFTIPDTLTVVDLFENQVARTPQNEALVVGENKLTYSELNERANQLAHQLVGKGVREEQIIGIYMERGLDTYVAVLAVLKAGAAYLPIDPKTPVDRIRYILEDADCELCLSETTLSVKLDDDFSNKILCLTDLEQEIACHHTSNLNRTVSVHQLAYVIYTSGSTGKPKGVLIEHGSLVNAILSYQRSWTPGTDDRVIQQASIAFDVSVCELFPVLCSGGCVVAVDEGIVLNPKKFIDLVQQQSITMFGGTPALLHSLQEHGNCLPKVRRVFSGADSLSYFQIKDFLSHTTVVNGYGPTETTVGATAYVIGEQDNRRLRIPIGKPLPNYSVFILDDNLRSVPLTCPGQLCIGGIALARGYLNREKLTAEKFVECEIFGVQQRVYKTGDIARWLADGNIEFIGRIDHQVKLRGFRIEIGEVEAALKKHSAIADAAVEVVGQSSSDSNLVAYLTLEEGAPALGKKEIQQFLKAFLPYYMIPSVYVTLESFIRSSSGKIDRKQLPVPEAQPETREIVPPRNDCDKTLLGIWSCVLEKEVESIDADFFEMGGHSLLATQVIARISDEFELDFPFQLFFEKSILADQANWIGQQAGTTQSAKSHQIEKAPVLEPSLAQLRMLFLTELDEDSTLYDMFAVLRLNGPLDVAAFSAAAKTLVSLHDSLKYAFPYDGDHRKLVILEDYDPVTLTDLSELNGDALEREWREICDRERNASMDLQNGPLFRIHHVQLNTSSHVVCLKLHHAISDGWSTAILFRHWADLYESMRSQKNPEVKRPTIQYHDFSFWQKRWMESADAQHQLDYWKQELAGLPDRIDLPTDFTRPKKLSYRGRHLRFVFPKTLSSKIKEFSRSRNATDFMSFLTVFKILLARYSNQDDFAVGSPVANRNQSQTEDIVGLFVNTLVFRSHYSDELSFDAFLHKTKETALGAYNHQDLPLESLVEELNPERNLSHSPLFQVLFGFQNASEQPLNLNGVETEFLPAEYEIAKFELTLSVFEHDGCFICEWEYNTDLFQYDTIVRMAQHFENLFASLIASPDEAVSIHSLLGESEERIFEDWNRTEMDLPSGVTCVDLFEAQVDQSPNHPAVIYGEENVSYAKLNVRANQLAQHLIECQIGPESLIAIYMERSPSAIVAMLGVLKAGAAFVPVSTDLPEKRLRYILDDCEVSVILTSADLSAKLPYGDYQVIQVEDCSSVESQAQTNPPRSCSPQNLAYVIYTSGSTGMPKGVMIEHLGLLNMIVGYQQDHSPSSLDRSLQQAALSFDVSIGEIFPSICSGSTVVMAPKDVVLDAVEFKRFLKENEISLFGATPGLLANLNLSTGELPRVRKVFSGGDAVNWNNIKELLALCPVINGYGPTEASVSATAYIINPNDGDRPSIPIGKPLPNYRIYVLNRAHQVQPIGIPGELCIAGVGLARSYLRRDQLTNEKFVEIEFAGRRERIYKTGDLVRWLPDGNLEFLGRIDNQVKLRGFRIELGEIESVIAGHDQVNETLVLLRKVGQTSHIIAYITVNAGQSKEEVVASIKEMVSSQLPEYMCPSAFVVLDQFPLTTNGKVDRSALPEPSFKNELQTETLPTTRGELTLCEIWSELLAREICDTKVSFFEVGGHSLLATQLATRIRDKFQVQIPLRTIFEHPEIESLGRWLDKQKNQDSTFVFHPRTDPEKYSASYAQKRLWFIDLFEGSSAHYNLCSFVKLSGDLNIQALQESLREIVRRHETLRSSFVRNGGEVVVHVHSASDALMIFPEEQSLSDVYSQLVVFANQPFDLSEGGLFHVHLYALSGSEYLLATKIHHIISDGWSMGVLNREISTLYNAHVRKEKADLVELKVQYGDFAESQIRWIAEEQLKGQIDYWTQQLKDVPDKIELPTDYPYPAEMTSNGAFYEHRIDPSLAESLKSLSAQNGVTQFMSLLAVFNLLLAKYSNSKDIVVGSPVAGRTSAEIENIIGFFVNNLVLRTEVDFEESFADLLKKVRSMTLDAYSNQDVPFDMLVELLNPKRSVSHSPLFQVLFTYMPESVDGLCLDEIDVAYVPPLEKNIPVKFDLTLEVVEQGKDFVCRWSYRTDLFKAETIERMARNFEYLIESVVDEPGCELRALGMVTPEDQALLSEWNQTACPYDLSKTVMDLISEQVQANPDRPALQHNDAIVSYKDLDRISNQLAHQLRDKGVQKGELVGIIMERSNDYYLAMLAILKAGGAFLPIDVGIPEKRMEYILRDADVSILFTHLQLIEKLPDFAIEKLVLEEEIQKSGKHPGNAPETNYDASSLAYSIYTSGSTGLPKGVLISHRNLINFIYAGRELLQISNQDKYLQQSSFSFDFSIINIFGPLCSGASIYTPDYETLVDPTLFVRTLKDQSITVFGGTPSLLSTLDFNPSDLPELRLILCGGEVLHLGRNEKWVGNVRIQNVYGPTEATVFATSCDVEPKHLHGKIPIGKPVSNYQIHILDEYSKVQPIGVPGELCISGESVALGYLNRPDLTDEKFIDVEINGCRTRVYRSGDLARWMTDGNIEFLGRIDHQVKIRGFRIELGEIEEALHRLEGVKEAVVIVKQKETTDTLVAFLVMDDFIEGEPEVLKEQLAAFLPTYMIPSMFVQLSAFPLNSSGKIDRRALNELATDTESPETQIVAPVSETEHELFAMWQQLLELQHFSVVDSFFDLGGHSLLVTQLVSRVQKRWKVSLPVKVVFEHPTIRLLAKWINQAESEHEGLTLQKRDDLSSHPIAFNQRALWYIDLFEEQRKAYHIHTFLKLRGEVDLEALENVFVTIVERHEALRSQFSNSPDGPIVHIVDPYNPVRIEENVFDEAFLNRYAGAFADEPFVLSSTPLFQVRILKTVDSGVALLIKTHHIIFDGWSMGVLNREIQALYQAYKEGTDPSLEPLTYHYGDFAESLHSWCKTDAFNVKLDTLRHQFRDTPVQVDLPTDFQLTGETGFKGGIIERQLRPELIQLLKSFAAKEGATDYMCLLTVFKLLIAQFSRSETIVVGTPAASRNAAEFEHVIGMFVNNLVLKTEIDWTQSFAEFVQVVKKVTLEAYHNQDVPFDLLVKEVNPDRNLAVSPLFQLVFNYHNEYEGLLSIEGVDVDPFFPETEEFSVKFDLDLEVFESKDGMTFQWVYRSDLFKAETIERLASNFEHLLEQLLLKPQQSFSSIQMLTPEDAVLLAKWNQTERSFDYSKSVMSLIAEQALNSPDQIALQDNDSFLTYGVLDKACNQLAHHLRTKGIQQGELVGILMERSNDYYIAMLAILKAGGAFLPIDSGLPDQRIKYILEDAKVSTLISHRRLLDRLPQFEVDSLVLEKEVEHSKMHPEVAPDYIHDELSPAYSIYTSGSTGKPKGVLVSHRNLSNVVYGCRERLPLTSEDRYLQQSSFSFDFSILNIFLPLCVGASIYTPDAETLVDPTLFRKCLSEYSITAFGATPSLLSMLDLNKAEFPELRLIFCGGETFQPGHYEKLLGGVQIYNLYGPTEATVLATGYEIPVGCQESKIPIGRPFPNYQIHILDQNLQGLPIGIPGELCIGGEGVALGYLNRPELTEEKFVDVQIDGETNRVYRSGDLARWLSDGNIEFLGRIDRQVKIRGYRIELGEVEEALNHLECVKEAVVVDQNRGGVDILVAYLILNHAVERLVPYLKDQLSRSLPSYMLPSGFVPVEVFPMNTSGKIDRNALQMIDAPDAADVIEHTPPMGETERAILEVWKELFEVDSLALDDDFFDLGGHSLMVPQLQTLLKEHGFDFSVKELFLHSTVRDLADYHEKSDTRQHTVAKDMCLDQEIILPSKLVPESTLEADRIRHPKNVLLTGATGFLGCWLLVELLQATDANVFCLVRGKQQDQRIENALKKCGCWQDQWSSRIIEVYGDLSQPRLGIEEATFQQLIAGIDTIYHNGAWVNHIYPYAALRASNVQSTLELLSLACTGRAKAFHYISTFSNFALQEVLGASKAQILESLKGSNHGYAISKWVSEQLIKEAAQRGLHVSIFRPRRIAGHSQSGHCNRDDFFNLLLQGCYELRKIPEIDDSIQENFVPVDYVAQSIVKLSTLTDRPNHTFDIFNPKSTPWRLMLEKLQRDYDGIERISVEKWRDELAGAPTNAFYPFLHVLDAGPVSDSSAFADAAKQFELQYEMFMKLTGVSCPEVSDELLKTYFNFFSNTLFVKDRTLNV